MRHGVYTFAFKIAAARRAQLDQLLAAWAPFGAQDTALAFAQIPTLHFASVTVFERRHLDDLLVLECNFDGPLDAFLDDFVGRAQGLEALLSHVQGAPPTSPAQVRAALRSAAVRPAAGFVAATGLSRDEIRASEALVGEMRQFLCDREEDLSRLSAADVAVRLRQTFGPRAPGIGPRRTLGELVEDYALVVLAALGLLVLIIAAFLLAVADFRAFVGVVAATTLILAAVLVAVVAFWRRIEAAEPVLEQPRGARIDAGAAREDPQHTGQNHFASIAPLKTGPMRWLSLRLFMWVLTVASRAFFFRGKLGAISTIHFAHWAVVDHGSSLIFFSNYSGRWGAYLDAFIQLASGGVNGVWSHCQGFPATHDFILGGCRQEFAFKRYARGTQSPEALWYGAYPQLTPQRVINNRMVVEAVRGRSKEPAERWLARI